MSFASVHDLRNDVDFVGRVTAADVTEALGGLAGTGYAERVLRGPEGAVVETIWQVAAAPGFGDKYDSALAGSVDRPGRDPSVISDPDITAAVQATWPDDSP